MTRFDCFRPLEIIYFGGGPHLNRPTTLVVSGSAAGRCMELWDAHHKILRRLLVRASTDGPVVGPVQEALYQRYPPL